MERHDVVEVTAAYAKHASGLSVLTDENFLAAVRPI